MNLVVFLMRNMSLAHYERVGMFDREMALYREHARHGVRTAIVTYGGREDLAFAPRLPGIKILCNWPGWPREAYERRLVWLHAPWLLRADIIKADQTDGAEVAVWSARRWGKPVVARSGYSLVDFQERACGNDSPQALEADRITRFVYGRARQVVVTTNAMAQQAIQRYGVRPDRVTTIPNYVDTGAFTPDVSVRAEDGRLCTIGRLEPQKNQVALVDAMAGTSWTLDLIGAGSEAGALRVAATKAGASVRFLDAVPNGDLAGYIRRAQVFVLPSLYEGHPKTLLEAMACGAAVLGADVSGIRDVISHGVNGWLCGTGAKSIRESLEILCGDSQLRSRLGSKAREFVVQNCSLPRIAAAEAAVYRDVVKA